MTTKEISDYELIENFKKGSKEAFEELILRYENKIYNIALRYTKNVEDTEEVLQDVCLTLYNKVKVFEGKSAFSSWLYRIVVNASLMKLRKRKQDKSILVEDLSFNAKQDYYKRSTDQMLSADSQSIRHETRSVIEEAINKLADEYKTVFIMRDVDGLSNQEVSETLNISIPAVKSRLHRARIMLQKKLDRYWKDYQGVEPMTNTSKAVNKLAVNY